jgi:hypothetical protein
MNQKPSIGRIVHFILNDYITAGFITNGQVQGERVAAIVTRVWSDTCVNLRLILDGDAVPLVTSVVQGTEPGQWEWPARV